MSEHIDNRNYRKEVIKKVITQLHEGKSVDEVKTQFEEAFKGVSATEISEVEQALISEGLPVSEVQRLCDVHAAVFKGSIEEIHQPVDKSLIPGHPTNILKQENIYIKSIIDKIRSLLSMSDLDSLKTALNELLKIDIHYSKKENLFFPYMEKYGITAPPKVMWGVDDEIRAKIKEVNTLLSTNPSAPDLKENIENTLEKVTEMIYKEENIMLPMLLDILTGDEWKKIADESGEIGFLIDKVPIWNPAPEAKPEVEKEKTIPGIINLPTGFFTTEELILTLNTLPFDITFVDKNGIVKYFSGGSERIFPRTKAIIGRNVSNCHPPASVHIVEKVVEDLKSGKKDSEDFWIKMGEKFVYIRYFAVRDVNKEFMGVLEVTQNIKPIQDITGEKRLISE